MWFNRLRTRLRRLFRHRQNGADITPRPRRSIDENADDDDGDAAARVSAETRERRRNRRDDRSGDDTRENAGGAAAVARSEREPRLGYCAGICGPTVMQEYVLDQRERECGSSAPTRTPLERHARTVTVRAYERARPDSIPYERFDDGDRVQILADLTQLVPTEPEVRLEAGACLIILQRDDATLTERVELPADIERPAPPRWRITNDILEITVEKGAL